jgi:hypothetical protein
MALIIPQLPIHVDDVVFFNEVRSVMFSVAKEYELKLKAVEGLPMPESGMADRLGDCSHTGMIRIVMRCTVDGLWCPSPLSPAEVWETAAHELAHLRYFDHGLDFSEFVLEMRQAIANRQTDHRQKVIDKLIKMRKQRDGEAALKNQHAAEAFAGAINRMMIDHELSPSDLDYAQAADKDPVVEIVANPRTWKDEPSDTTNYLKKTRVAWQEALARTVANAHLCQFLVNRHSNVVTFVGTKSHAMVAEYVYGVLVPNAYWMSRIEANDYKKKYGSQEARGFQDSWLNGFVLRINQRFDDERRAAVAELAKDMPGGTSTALIRLSGALQKAQTYISNKFVGHASAIHMKEVSHDGGYRAGKAAADRMPIGRKAVATPGPKGQIGGDR